MAVHLGAGGNCCITIGGQFNAGAPDVPPESNWTNPLSGLTALTVAISIKPDPFSAQLNISPALTIFHMSGTAFILDKPTLANGQLRFRVLDVDSALGQFNDRVVRTTSTVALGPGVWNRLMVRWQATGSVMAIWNNGVALPLDAQGGTGTVNKLSITTGSFPSVKWPIEIGAVSTGDTEALYGDYAEPALWGSYLPDADAVKYGQGYSPNLLTPTNRISYHKLIDTGQAWNTPNLDPSLAGSTLNEWTGVLYGAGQPTPFGGIFQTFAVAPHPQVIYEEPAGAYVPHLIEDAPSLPTVGFERYELEGFPGQRTGTNILVPQAMAIYDSIVAAVPGDDISLDPSVVTTTPWVIELPAKTVDAATKRMPPTMQRNLITMSQPVTMS